MPHTQSLVKKLLLGFVAAIVVTLVIAATQPAEFRIERQTSISGASDIDLFNAVNQLRNWSQWSPWDKLDPQMQKDFSGPDAGVGASYSWKGNSEVGEGTMTIITSVPHSEIGIKLEFLKPFAATNLTYFQFKTEGNATRVTWSMTGEKSFIAKLFGLFINMDKLVGSDFEKGLAALKEQAENSAAGR